MGQIITFPAQGEEKKILQIDFQYLYILKVVMRMTLNDMLDAEGDNPSQSLLKVDALVNRVGDWISQTEKDITQALGLPEDLAGSDTLKDFESRLE
jgi:hypothetical protein